MCTAWLEDVESSILFYFFSCGRLYLKAWMILMADYDLMIDETEDLCNAEAQHGYHSYGLARHCNDGGNFIHTLTHGFDPGRPDWGDCTTECALVQHLSIPLIDVMLIEFLSSCL